MLAARYRIVRPSSAMSICATCSMVSHQSSFFERFLKEMVITLGAALAATSSMESNRACQPGISPCS
jgi:hypothetical protein